MKIWLALFVASLTSYLLISTYLAYIFFGVLLYIVLSDLYIIGSASLNLGTFKNSTLFYKKVTGAYNFNNLNPHFDKACKLLESLKLNDKYEYNSFGLYLDDPKKVDEANLRSCIGIAYTPSEKGMNCDQELINYCKTNGWETLELTAFPAIVSRFPLVSYMFFMLAIRRFYKDLERSLLDVDFVKSMRINVENIPCIIEVYKPNMIEFYVPKLDKQEEKDRFSAISNFSLFDKKNK